LSDQEWRKELAKLLSEPTLEHLRMSIDIIDKNIPRKLYKYMPVDVPRLSSIKMNFLHCSSPSNFNDPYDSLMGYDMEEILNNEFTGGWERFVQLIMNKETDLKAKENALKIINSEEDVLNRYNTLRSNNIYVSCFSAVNDSMLMWSHYADSHKGICVEYDLSKEGMRFVRSWIYPVLYSDKVVLRREYQNSASSMFDQCVGKIPNVDRELYVLYVLPSLFKYYMWAYEEEWRFIVNKPINSKEDYVLCDTPSAIYLGSKISFESENMVHSICQDKGISLYKMHIDRAKYRLSSLPA
jgi:hypothetical protein